MSCGSPRRGRGPSKSNWNKNFAIKTSGPVPVRLVWVELSPGTRLDNFGTHALPVDVLLGGPLTEYVRLSRAGRLEPLDGQGAPFWFVARRRQIVLSDGFSQGHEQIAFDDPRVDPPTMAWAAGQLRKGSWRAGYARLVLLFSHSFHRPGWQSGSAAAAANRGEAAHTLRVAALSGSASEGDLDPSVVPWNEGAAILRGNWHAAPARAFLRFLADHHGATPGRETSDLDPEVSDLLADLLGATLVDAQEELLIAGSALAARAPASAQAQAWLTEPPPWPPASVEKLQTGEAILRSPWSRTLPARSLPIPSRGSGWCRAGCGRARLIDQSLLTELARAPVAAWCASLGSVPGCAGNGQPGHGNGIVVSRGLPPARVLPRGQRRHVLLCLETDPEPG